MITITVMNDKGGVAKTTSVVSLAAEFGARGFRTLVLDLDPQANLTRSSAGLRLEQLEPTKTTCALLLPEEVGATEPPRPQAVELGFDLIPSLPRLIDAEVKLLQDDERLARSLEPYSDYDFIFLDTGPAWGTLHKNALFASDGVLIPVIPNLSSTGGLESMFLKIEAVRRKRPQLQTLGVFATKVQRTALHRQLQLVMERQFKELWLPAPIPQGVAIENAEVFHQAVRAYDRHSRPANAYRLLADATLRRLQTLGLLDAERVAA